MKKNQVSWAWWYTSVIPTIQEIEMEVSQFEASPAKKLTSPYLKTSQVR
jgi:hypothetical protein